MEQQQGQSKDFFISYTSADKRWAEWIAWQLEAAGYTTIIQAWDFQAGGNFVLDMNKATMQAARTIAVLSPDYFASKFTPSEWAAAFRALAGEFLPPASQGHILLTTRASSTRGLAKLVGVDTLDLEDGTHFLLRRAGLLTDDASVASANSQEVMQAQELVREMDGLPLALDQAGAYIEEIQCGIGHYLSLYRTHRAYLLKERVALTMDHPRPVATTWSLSFQIIEEQNLAAADLLRECAFLQPDAIPEEILREGGRHLGPHIQRLVIDPLAFDEALKLLLSYSLIRRNVSEKLLSIHRLVQAVIIDGVDEQVQREWAERTVAAVLAVLPRDAGDHRQWQRYERCLVQALGCVALIDRWQIRTTVIFWLLYLTAWYLKERARYAEAEPLYRRALEIGMSSMGPLHANVAIVLNALAILYFDQGKYGEAEPLYERALHIHVQVLGLSHRLTREVAKNYASLLRAMKRDSEADDLEARFSQSQS